MLKRIKALICTLLCVNIMCTLLPAALAESTDAETNTITISSRDEFFEFCRNCRLDSYSIGLTVSLEADIDLTGAEFESIPTFSGIFLGNGHTVYGLSIQGTGSVQGLFRYVRRGAQIYDLKVQGEINPAGSHSRVGGIAGCNYGNIVGCSFNGSVSGAESIGGIAGRNEMSGIIENCSVSGSVHGDHFVGGVAGNNLGVVRACTNEARINTTPGQNNVEISDITVDSLTGVESASTATDIGGIAGTSSGVIRDCENNGTVGYPQIGYNVGGICGSQIGYITGCVNSGEVYGRKEVGGIVGQMEPSTRLKFETDTLQILQGQLTTMSAMINSTAANAQAGTDQLSAQTGVLQGQVGNAMDAVDQLIPNGSGEPFPDEDTTNAALSNLSGAVTSIPGTIGGMAATGEDTVTVLTGNLQQLSNQMNTISGTVGGASDNLGGSITDISDADTEQDITGKVEGCVNRGAVHGDLNTGGIVGAMSIENDLDPESDVQVYGNTSLNFSIEARVVVLACENTGTVSVGKRSGGGIAGWMSLGLVRRCVNTGMVDAPAASYVGGIAGLSDGYIRECSSKCALSGASYVGGIAGTCGIVSDCRSMTEMIGGSEYLGAVLGYSDDILEAESGTLPIQGNYYPVAGEDAGAIDGISYSGAAEGLDLEAFLALQGLPDVFSTVTLSFVYEDGVIETTVLSSGEILAPEHIPAVPDLAGYTGAWDGVDEMIGSRMFFDRQIALIYTEHDSVISSAEERTPGGLPLLLAQGEFSSGQVLSIRELDNVQSIGGKGELVEVWQISLPENKEVLLLRFLLPEQISPERVRIYACGSAGEWRMVEHSVDGSYAVFEIAGEEDTFALELVPADYTMEIIAASASAVLLAALLVVRAVIRKKKALS